MNKINPNGSATDRKELLQAAVGERWDFIIVGGGASGLGTALEAATRGYRVLLLERFDFAKGTSSRSTKLVHGGVRYLAQGNIKLVREASIERGYLHRNARHLVKNQVFLVPMYNWWDRMKYTHGLKLYDWIAGRLSLGASTFIGRKRTAGLMPGVKTTGLKGAVWYHDGQFDDARLAINLAQTVLEQGGITLNYFNVTGITKNEAGSAVFAVDAETGTGYSFQGRVVINAGGVFVDEVRRLADATHPVTITVSQGIHLVVDRSFYSSAQAMMIPETSDGRVLFAVPWHGKVVLGTTDTALKEHRIEPSALDSEISFILDNAKLYLDKAPTRADVLSVFAGLRPLAAPSGTKEKTKEISRSHKIISDGRGMFTMLGGKWTTYRRMAEDMVDRVEKEAGWTITKSVTRDLPIHGDAVPEDGLLYFYGADLGPLMNRIRDSGKSWISEPYGIHEETIRWAVEKELARTLEDVLARRNRILFLDARAAKAIAPEVAAVMASLLGHDAGWEGAQVSGFETLCDSWLP
ncbi:MAG: glycerol-3-phosphate dehydrogenase/oxidase [Chitinophagaceae bacterium]|nr:MAG: glycerol-3-phosphate dehydrogenase/oxidase [Chitinophagaceae bacterium]